MNSTDPNNDWQVGMESPMPIEFDLYPTTRGVINGKDQMSGRDFGVFALNCSEDDFNESIYLNNVKATCSEQSGDIRFGLSDVYYYPLDSDKLNFYSYHPYSGQTHKVSEDGSKVLVSLNLGADDILYSKADEGYNVETVLNYGKPGFSFQHVTSGLKFAVEKTSEASDFTVQKLTFHNAPVVVDLCIVDNNGNDEGTLTWQKRTRTLNVEFDKVIFVMPNFDYQCYVTINDLAYGPIAVNPGAVSEGLDAHKPGYIYKYKFIIDKDINGYPTIMLAKDN